MSAQKTTQMKADAVYWPIGLVIFVLVNFASNENK